VGNIVRDDLVYASVASVAYKPKKPITCNYFPATPEEIKEQENCGI